MRTRAARFFEKWVSHVSQSRVVIICTHYDIIHTIGTYAVTMIVGTYVSVSLAGSWVCLCTQILCRNRSVSVVSEKNGATGNRQVRIRKKQHPTMVIFDDFVATMSNTSDFSNMTVSLELQCTFLPTWVSHQTRVLIVNFGRKRWSDLRMTSFAEELKSSLPKPYLDIHTIKEW